MLRSDAGAKIRFVIYIDLIGGKILYDQLLKSGGIDRFGNSICKSSSSDIIFGDLIRFINYGDAGLSHIEYVGFTAPYMSYQPDTLVILHIKIGKDDIIFIDPYQCDRLFTVLGNINGDSRGLKKSLDHGNAAAVLFRI